MLYTKHEQFVCLIQTGAIVRDMQGGRDLAVAVVWSALKMPAEAIPNATFDDPDAVHNAAVEWLDYQYGVGHRPSWVPDRMPRPPR